jgi:hypothetical protein
MLQIKTKQQASEWLGLNYHPGWLAFEFDPADKDLDFWQQLGYRAGFVFNRANLSWSRSDACAMYGEVLRYFENTLGPIGHRPAGQRPWNRYVSLVDQREWIVVCNPALITLALLAANIEQQT